MYCTVQKETELQEKYIARDRRKDYLQRDEKEEDKRHARRDF
jgi:hypothetical protein